MRLSRIYSDREREFPVVNFKEGLNVVKAEIRLPENLAEDTHNLGKTTLGRLIDFCFLSKRNANFFLFKHESLFKKFTFYLEIELEDLSFITIKRGVENPSKISFKRHTNGGMNFSQLDANSWNHEDVPFERAKDILDGILDWRVLKPYTYRKGLGYLLRSQEDYRDVFQLNKFSSAHSDWKPFLAQLLGFDSKAIFDYYQKEKEISTKESALQTILREIGGSEDDVSKIEGILLLKNQDVDSKQRLLDAFDFREQDKDKTKNLVDDIDSQIAELNSRRYSLLKNKKKIGLALNESQLLFSTEEAQRLFGEAGVLFEGQIKKDFQQLIDFNKAITEERQKYLKVDLFEIEAELKVVNKSLGELGEKRLAALSFLKDEDIFNKYKKITDEVIGLRANIALLEAQRSSVRRLQDLKIEIRSLYQSKAELQEHIEVDLQKQESDSRSKLSKIRIFFSEIVEEVIGQKALLNVHLNQQDHFEFNAEILDQSGSSTSADAGHTYKKLLCIAFDMAVLRANIDDRFPRFVFHDGVFESLDDRKKENLIGVIKRYAALGLQPIITLIDSDIPVRLESSESLFDDSDIVLKLHDEGADGRLFKMQAW